MQRTLPALRIYSALKNAPPICFYLISCYLRVKVNLYRILAKAPSPDVGRPPRDLRGLEVGDCSKTFKGGSKTRKRVSAHGRPSAVRSETCVLEQAGPMREVGDRVRDPLADEVAKLSAKVQQDFRR